jgi:hypothetical protein
MKSLRQLIQSIVYAGMKDHEPATKSEGPAVLNRFLRPFERFLNGPGSADPLYVTNRTVGQKIRLAVLIAIPPLLVLGIGGVIVHFNRSVQRKPPKQVNNAEIAAKMLPDLSDVSVYSNKAIDVMDVSIQQSGTRRLTGSLKNNSDNPLDGVEVILDLTNAMGSRLGAISCKISHIQPRGRAKFQTEIAQKDAVFAIVREIRIQ